MNETLYLVDGRTALRTERRLAHPPAKVWRAVTEPEHLDEWFPFRVEVDLRVGGEIRFLPRPPGEGPATAGVVTAIDPPRRFAFTWGDHDDLRFELSPDGDDGCLLVFTHTFTDHYGAASFTSGWRVCLDAMAAVLDGRAFTPPDDMAEMHDAYVVELGLDEPTAESTDDAWRVRFERQMTRPAETVWTALTGARAPVVGDAAPAHLAVDGIDTGRVTAVDEPKLLEYEWLDAGRAAGRVRFELGDGTGQGARLVLVQTGPAASTRVRVTAATAWKARLERLAVELRSTSG